MSTGIPLLLPSDDSVARFLTRKAFGSGTSEPYQEKFLQQQIDQSPELLPITDYFRHARTLVSFGTEIVVDLSDKQGRIDNLLITDDGHIVVVETKLHRNPEGIREVIAQALHYCMAISKLGPSEFEAILKSAEGPNRLQQDQSVAMRLKSVVFDGDQFDHDFDTFRETGEILLLIVGDGIKISASRLVEWMNDAVGSRPCRFGLVELRIYDSEHFGRLIVPHTLLRTTDASRHVVSIQVSAEARQIVDVSVLSPDGNTQIKPAPNTTLMTEESLLEGVDLNQNLKWSSTVRELLKAFHSNGLIAGQKRTALQFGIEIQADDYLPLVNLSATSLWVQLPVRAVRALGPDRFISCKQALTQIAPFYRSNELTDALKTIALTPKYSAVSGKEEQLGECLRTIGKLVQDAILAADALPTEAVPKAKA